MKRILLRIAYDGTAYHGFQVQENAPTVEGEIRRAISALTGKEPELIGGSRTDAGVHALDNVAVFDTESRIEAGRFSGALNARLPEDIRVVSACEVPADFHPRHRGTRKTYEYRILCAPISIPTYRLYTYPTRWALDTEAMRRAADYLCGEHDFKAFASAHAQTATSVRTIYAFEVMETELFSRPVFAGYSPIFPAPASRMDTSALMFPVDKFLPENGNSASDKEVQDSLANEDCPSDDRVGANDKNVGMEEERVSAADKGVIENDRNVIFNEGVREITLRVTGNGFLYNMVRILAGTLVEVGRGRISPEEIPTILESRDRAKAGPTLPPQGLCLTRYEFED